MDQLNKFLRPLKPGEFHAVIQTNAMPLSKEEMEGQFDGIRSYLERTAIGPYFWFIADRIKGVTYAAGGQVAALSGLDAEEFVGAGPQAIFARTHPEDVPKMMAFSQYWSDFISAQSIEERGYFVTSIFLRLKNQDEKYAWVMVQFLDTYLDARGQVLYTFTAVTDVAHIMNAEEALMSIRNYKNNFFTTLLCGTDGVEVRTTVQSQLTPRELEVLKLLASGFSSKQIAAELSISIHTVHNHRKSLLRKTSKSSTAELMAYAAQMGYLGW